MGNGGRGRNRTNDTVSRNGTQNLDIEYELTTTLAGNGWQNQFAYGPDRCPGQWGTGLCIVWFRLKTGLHCSFVE